MKSKQQTKPKEGYFHPFLQVPCSLIYGESDWMDPRAGQRIFDSMLQERGKLSSSDLQVTVVNMRMQMRVDICTYIF